MVKLTNKGKSKLYMKIYLIIFVAISVTSLIFFTHISIKISVKHLY